MQPDRQCARCGTALPKDAPEGLCPACLIHAGIGTDQGATETNPGRGPNAPPPSPQEIARRFPQLEILELIGQGGMGIVYKARQPRLDRVVALKILPLESGRDPTFAERFAREARALARLNHPHIVAIYDFGEVDGLYYFLMEHVDGVDLRQLERSGRLSPEQALSIVPRICDALQYAHEEGIVHRDIKPGNILIDKKGRVKIADFGLAKLVGNAPGDLSLTGAGQFMGTPHYMAPEQINRPKQVDHRADIYSLGVVFYEMLTGELPVGRFAAPSRKVRIDVRLDDIVLRALENNPERRYQQASEFKTEVETVAHHTLPRIAAEPDRAPKPSLAPLHLDPDDRARRIVQRPGTALMIYGIVNLVSLLLPAGMVVSHMPAFFHPPLSLPIHGWPLVGISSGFGLLLSLAPLAAAISLLVGASKLRTLASYRWSLAAALIALLPPPVSWFWPIGLGLGVWALIAIHQPVVKSAFDRQLQAQSRHPALDAGTARGHVIPIISRKAIVGACLVVVPCAPLPLPILLGIPLATTILGLAAIKDIRYSNGRIVGLSLALADALLFPLLVLNGLVLFSLQAAVRGTGLHLDPVWMAPEIALPFFLLGLLVCAALNYIIVRACWRAARRPVA